MGVRYSWTFEAKDELRQDDGTITPWVLRVLPRVIVLLIVVVFAILVLMGVSL